MPTTTEDLSHEAMLARAREADQGADDLERRADAGEDIPLADMKALRDQADNWRWRARPARTRAAAAAEARRMEALGVLAADVQAAAAGAATDELQALLGRLTADAAAIRQAAATHNQAVKELRTRGQALAVQDPAPSGPRAASGHVALTVNGIRAGETELMQRADVETLITRAVQGKPAEAGPAVLTHAPAQRPAYAILGEGRMVTPVQEITEHIRSGIDTGSSVQLTSAEIDAWWAGTLDTRQIDHTARGRAQVTAARAAERARYERIRAGEAAARERNEAAAQERTVIRRSM
jgi:hypothetical protein